MSDDQFWISAERWEKLWAVVQAAIAYCEGTPLRSEIEQRSSSGLQRATDAAAEALTARFGSGAVDGKIQAHVVSVRR